MGFPFFKPIYSKEYKINIRGGPIAKETLKKYLNHQMEAPYFPSRFNSIKADFSFTHGLPIIKKVGIAEIEPILLNHPNNGYGYKIIENGKSFVYLTDN